MRGFFLNMATSHHFREKILSEFRGFKQERSSGKVRPLAESIAQYLKTAKLEQKVIESRIVSDWGSIVGKFNAEHSTPLAIRNHVLTIGVPNSVYLYEFDRQKSKWLKNINNIIGSEKIRKIIFKVGGA